MSFNLLKSIFRILFLALFMCSSVSASPWISVGETRLKQNLHLLNDTGAITISLTTWPIMWSDVNKALKRVDESQLNSSQLIALKELKFEMHYQTKKEMKRSLEIAASSSRAVFRDFSGQEYEKGRISHLFDWDGEDFAFKLQANLTTDPGKDTTESQFYGSYVAGVLGNWVLGAGAFDRWWGAGHQSSLILTNNARPVPAVFLRTKGEQQFDSPWLSWLGDWQFVSFVGQLESSRVIPEAKLTGMRFTFKPFDNLEIGLSRAMQWGGDGRSESFSTFFKSLTSQGENTSEQAGNQLAGYDLRYTFLQNPSYGGALYAQAIGEDEAGYLPSKLMAQIGIESNFALESGATVNVFLEHTNTTAGAFGGEQLDTSYEHSVYKTGFRHRGRVIGASLDNDSKVFSLGLSYQFRAASQRVSAIVSKMQLNTDGGGANNSISVTDLDIYSLDLGYQRIFFGGKLGLMASYLNELPELWRDEAKRFTISSSWVYRF